MEHVDDPPVGGEEIPQGGRAWSMGQFRIQG